MTSELRDLFPENISFDDWLALHRYLRSEAGMPTVDAMIKAVRGGDKFAEHVVRRYIAWAIDRGRFGELLVWFQAIALEIISIGRISRA